MEEHSGLCGKEETRFLDVIRPRDIFGSSQVPARCHMAHAENIAEGSLRTGRIHVRNDRKFFFQGVEGFCWNLNV